MFSFGLSWWIYTYLIPAIQRLPEHLRPIEIIPILPSLPM